MSRFCTGIVVGLCAVVTSCTHPHEKRTDSWESAPGPSEALTHAQVAKDAHIVAVAPGMRLQAVARLGKSTVQSLTVKEFARYCTGRVVSSAVNTHYCLVRCLAVADPERECRLYVSGKEAWLEGGMLSHHNVTPVHWPVVIIGPTCPKTVFVSYSTAE